MKKILNYVVIIVTIIFITNPIYAKEKISGSLSDFVYLPYATPKQGAIYIHNPQVDYPLQVVQALKGGVLINGDFNVSHNQMKNIYVQTTKQYVTGQWLSEPIIVKFIGTMDYTSLVGNQRVWKFYKYGKAEIEKNVDFDIPTATKQKSFSFDELISTLENELENRTVKELVKEDYDVYLKKGKSLYGEIIKNCDSLKKKTDAQSIQLYKYNKRLLEEINAIISDEMPCDFNKLEYVKPQNNPINFYIWSINKILDSQLNWYYAMQQQNTKINKAINTYTQNAINQSQHEREIAYNDLYTLAKNSVDKINKVISDNNITLNTSFVMNNRSKINAIGYDFSEAEGMYYICLNYLYLLKVKDIPESWIEWLKLKEKYKNVWDEGGANLSANAKYNAILEIECFIRKYPNFIALMEVEQELKHFMFDYLSYYEEYCTQFNFDTKKLKNEYKISYEKFLCENKQSIYYPIVKKYYTKLKLNLFKNSNSIQTWVRNEINF